jgi:hypothetical protein
VAFDVLKDTAATVSILPPNRWASATATVLSPAGTSLATPTATLDTVDTTISSATDESTLVVASATGITVGQSYEIGANGWTAISRVAAVDGTTITLLDPLPETPAASDTFKGVEFSVTIAAAQTATLGANYRLKLTTGNEQTSEVFHVVRTKFNDPVTSQRVRRLVAYMWPSMVNALPADAYDVIAEDSNNEIRRRLLATGRYPFLFGDSGALEGVGLLQAKIRLIDYNMVGPGTDPDAYRTSLYFELRDRMGEVITSLTAYDSDDDGDQSDEDRRRYTSVLLTR